MEQQSTIPSVLRPITLPGGLQATPEPQAQTPILMKLVFWAALGLLAFGALKFWMR